MSKLSHAVWVGLSMSMGALALATSARAQSTCEPVPIDMRGAVSGRVVDINNWGHVTGELAFADAPVQSFVWHNGRTTLLPGLRHNASIPRAMNDLGQVVGYSWADDAVGPVPVVWTGGRIRRLPAPDGVYAVDINNRGQILGSNGRVWPNAWSSQVALPGLSGEGIAAQAFNEVGDVVGFERGSSGHNRAFVYRSGTLTVLDPIASPYDPSVEAQTYLFDVNNSGLASGYADFGCCEPPRPVVWTGAGGGDLLPHDGSSYRVDEWGNVYVGDLGDDGFHVYLTNRAGKVTRDYPLTGFLDATDVVSNDRFQIAWRRVNPLTIEDYLLFTCQLR